MQASARILATILSIQSCLCQILECPTFCICYKWQSLSRIDCVRQGLLDVNIGLNGESNSKDNAAKKTRNYVQVLDLSHNSISILDDSTFMSEDLIRLEAIHLSHNSIAHISPSAFKDLRNLRLLDLSHNRLRRNQGFKPQPLLLPAQIFTDAPNLRALRLGFNPLEKEDHHGKNDVNGSPLLLAPQLEFLDLGSCRLGHLDTAAFTGLESLRMLNLSDNQLITLNPSVLGNMKNLTELFLSSNPWPCEGSKELANLDAWIVNHGFDRICPINKFEKLAVLNPRDQGPQKAKDSDSLLYLYQLLGTLIKDDESLKLYHSSDLDNVEDVEVFQELEPKKNDRLSIINTDISSSSNDSPIYYDLNCRVYGIPMGWFLALAFQAGVFVSFLGTFCWFANPCKGIFIRSVSQEWNRRRNSASLQMNKRLSRSEQFSSRERHHLLTGSENELQNMGLTTPILPRSANSMKNNSPKPPSYEEHLALHTIRVDP